MQPLWGKTARCIERHRGEGGLTSSHFLLISYRACRVKEMHNTYRLAIHNALGELSSSKNKRNGITTTGKQHYVARKNRPFIQIRTPGGIWLQSSHRFYVLEKAPSHVFFFLPLRSTPRRERLCVCIVGGQVLRRLERVSVCRWEAQRHGCTP